MEDAALLQEISQGQSAALGELYDRYGRLVYSLAVHIVYEQATAEEITQEVFLQVWNKAGSFQPNLGKVSSWLASVTRNRSIDVLRRMHSRPEGHQAVWDGLDDTTGPEWVDPLDVEATVEQDLQSRAIRQAISQLPEEQRQTLALAYFGGLSQQQISDLTGTPLGTVKTRLRLAMQKLRLALEASQQT